MPAFNPIQTGFQAGVLSPRMRGRVDTKVYRAGLARCENWVPTPQGSLLKANGYRIVAASPGGPVDPLVRVLPFKSTSLGRFQIGLANEKLYVFTPAGALGAFAAELVTNSECNLNAGGWTFSGSAGAAQYAGVPGDYYLRFTHATVDGTAAQTLAAVPAGTFRFQFRVRKFTEFSVGVFEVTAKIGTAPGGSDLLSAQTSAAGDFSFTVTHAAPGDVYVQIQLHRVQPVPVAAEAWVDDVSFRDATPDTFVDAPWKTEDIPLVQYAGETGRDRMVLVHPKYEPQVLTRGATGVWVLSPISTVGWAPPLDKETHTTPVFAGSEWPSVVDVWQGRLWLAATALKKNTFWASRPGGYDFTATDYNALTAGDGFSYDVAMRGEIRWMQGQKVMLVGCDDGEYSISANDGVVYAGNLGISQESAFGSAQIQAQPIGDEVLFVSPDRRKVRAMKFSLEGGGWYSRDITFTAEHVTKPGIVDLAFARDPFSAIVLCLADGTLAVCNYDRVEDVRGWWTRTPTEALLTSVSVQTTSEGDEIWAVADLQMAAPYNGAAHLVRIPLYETDSPELDSAVGPLTARVIFSDGTAAYNAAFHKVFTSGAMFNFVGGRFRIAGTTFEVTAVTDPFEATAAVVSGPDEDIAATADWEWLSWHIDLTDGKADPVYPFAVSLSADTAVTVVNTLTNDIYSVLMASGSVLVLPDGVQEEGPFLVGRNFTARAETLPLEGGNPAGTSQGFKVHYPDISARISDSVPPLLNGKRASEGRPFSTPLDTVEPRVSADVKVKNLGLSEGGIITIEQDLPFRTEVCAIYGQAQINKV